MRRKEKKIPIIAVLRMYSKELVNAGVELPNIAYSPNVAELRDFRMDCPVCGGRHKNKLIVNIDSNTTYCFGGGKECFSGSAEEIWYYFKTGILPESSPSRFEIRKKHGKQIEYELNQFINSGQISADEMNRFASTKFVEQDIANPDYVHSVYRHLFGKLGEKYYPLSDRHYSELRERGMSDELIESLNFRSAPAENADMVAIEFSRELEKVLAEEGLGVTPEGVSGFYENTFDESLPKYLFVPLMSGLIIPNRNVKGRYLVPRLRPDEENGLKGAKYLWVSSAKRDTGYKTLVSPMYVGPLLGEVKRLVITEGELNAFIINQETGDAVLSMPGVGILRGVEDTLEYLKSRGLEEVGIAFDADWRTNKQVRKALRNLVQLVREVGIRTYQITWETVEIDGKVVGNGYDDYLVYKNKGIVR